MPHIHPTALVDPTAELGVDVEVGPFCLVEAGARIGDRTKLAAHAVICGHTILGADNQVGVGAILGGAAQDIKLDSPETWLEIGDGNIIREYVTFHRSNHEGGVTRIGSHNFFMAFVHIGHDCTVGNHIQMANTATLGGHCLVEDRAVIGGLTAIHQRVTIGTMAMVGGSSGVNVDVPPYSMVQGSPAHVIGHNMVGLRRNGVSSDAQQALRTAIRILFKSGRHRGHAIQELTATAARVPEVTRLLEFAEASRRGRNGRQLER